MKKESQLRIVLEWLQHGHTITSMQAFEMWKITRLSAIIFVIRHDLEIDVKDINIGGGYSIYTL